ncbi:group I truncated hemoglobin [Motilibacter deserti]|uniref:Group 1 truncated hemoglobin n=1 Tax=Motilibacter deserti TaxID=2714956 RepID=A0ABX0GP18_9ACTN|nr:group 1 truncated hemoglobin [Motilibacter deserti]
MSIYDVLGQEHGIRAAVDEFYRRVLGDPALAGYFEGVDMARLRQHQAALLVQVTGGPKAYEGRDLAQAHRSLGITSADFDRVVGHLAATLTSLGVDDETLGTVAAALGAHRDDIVADPVPSGS